MDKNIPFLKDFVNESQHSFDLKIVKNIEFEIIKKLNWNLKHTIGIHFVSFILSSGFIFKPDTINNKQISLNDLTSLDENYILLNEMLLKCQNVNKYLPSIIGCSFVAALRKLCKLDNPWNSNLIQFYHFKYSEIFECMNLMIQYF